FELRSDVAGARLETRLVGRLLEAVPGANVLADVAAVEPAFEVARNFVGQLRLAQFDCGVRDAARGVEQVRLDDCAGRARLDAKRARAAVVFDARVVRLQLDVEDEFAEEDPRAVFARDEVRVLAYPAQARALGPDLVHRGLRVNANLAARFGREFADEGE